MNETPRSDRFFLECCSTCEFATASLVDDQNFLAFDALLRGHLIDVDFCFKEPPCP